MKFRYRLFLALLTVFLLFIDIAAYTLLSRSFSLNLEREEARALGESRLIAQSVESTLTGIRHMTAPHRPAASGPVGRLMSQTSRLCKIKGVNRW
jgi:hypothetical protein